MVRYNTFWSLQPREVQESAQEHTAGSVRVHMNPGPILFHYAMQFHSGQCCFTRSLQGSPPRTEERGFSDGVYPGQPLGHPHRTYSNPVSWLWPDLALDSVQSREGTKPNSLLSCVPQGKSYDETVDVFSFGIVLCEVSSGMEAGPEAAGPAAWPPSQNWGSSSS